MCSGKFFDIFINWIKKEILRQKWDMRNKVFGKGRVQKKNKKKSNLDYFWVWPPPLKVIISFSATRPIFENFWKKVYFSPWKSPKHLEKFSKKGKNKSWASRCQPHRAKCRPTAQNVGRTAQNVGRTRVMSAATRLMFVKDQRGGFMCPPGPKGPPLYKKNFSV